MNKNNKVCKICGQPIRNGIKLKKEFICDKCEKEIVNLDIDSEKYLFYKNKIKQILFR